MARSTLPPAEQRTDPGQGTSSRGSDWKLAVIQSDAGPIISGDVTLPASLRFDVDGHDELVINTVLSGAAEYHHRQVDQFRPGDLYIGNHPGLHCVCYTHQLHARTITLPRSLLAAVAGPAGEEPPAGWDFPSLHPVTGGTAQWQQAVRFIDDLLAMPDATLTPLIIGSAARLLATTALAIFPCPPTTEPTRTDQSQGHPVTVRRAVSFIEANPDRDISMADIAAAASVTTRAVQAAFRRHLDTTPMTYLRRVRLDLAHRDLQTADSQRTTVTAVAYRWGFASASRFATEYRSAYGVLPSHTLRS